MKDELERVELPDAEAARERLIEHVYAELKKIAGAHLRGERRGQTLAQLAIAWVLRDERVTSVLIGASSVQQLENSVGALDNLAFTPEELAKIDRHAVEGGINLWQTSSSH